MADSQIIGDVQAAHLYDGVCLPMWVLYDHPTDLPGHYVLRLWDAMTNRMTPFVFLASSLEEATAQVEGRFARLERSPGDDAKIVAVFL